jgi:flavin-binding protein dodecin
MSVVKVIEILAQSENSWEEAAKEAVKSAAKSVKNIKHVYIKDFQAEVENNDIALYRVTAKVSFLVEE